MQIHVTRFYVVGIHFLYSSWLDSRCGPEIVLPKGYGGNRPSVQWVPETLPRRYCGRSVKLTTELYLQPRLWMLVAIPPHSVCFSWGGA